MKKKEILPEDDNMFEGAFELIINDTSDANVDITDDGDPRELLVVNEHIQGRVDQTGEKYLYRIFPLPYDISEAAQKYLYMKNFNRKVYITINYLLLTLTIYTISTMEKLMNLAFSLQ